MNTPQGRTKSLLASTACILALSWAPAAALAEDITLTSDDGATTVSGALLDFDGTNFVIASSFGDLIVPQAGYACDGAACPDAGTVTWDVSLWGKRRAFTEHVEKLAELVAEKSGGTFTLNISYGGLSDSRDNLDGISAGAFEMAQFCAGYHRDKNPSITVLELPFLGVSTLEEEIALSRAVYEHPATQADLARWNATLLMPSPLPQYNIAGAGSPPLSLDDFKSLSIRATGGVGKAVETLGAELVAIPATEVRQAMEDSQVQAVSFAPHAHMAFGTLDNSLWWTTNLNPGTVNCPVAVNSDALDSLTPPHRVALLSSVDAALDHYVAHYNGKTMEAWGPALLEHGIIELTIHDSIIASIRDEVAAPAAAEWIRENAANGLPAQELYDLVTGMIRTGS